MQKIKVASFKELGIDLLLVPFDQTFASKTHEEKSEIIRNLHLDASSSGMKGTVVPIWNDGEHRHFIAPIELHPFIRGFSWNEIQHGVNGVINMRT